MRWQEVLFGSVERDLGRECVHGDCDAAGLRWWVGPGGVEAESWWLGCCVGECFGDWGSVCVLGGDGAGELRRRGHDGGWVFELMEMEMDGDEIDGDER